MSSLRFRSSIRPTLRRALVASLILGVFAGIAESASASTYTAYVTNMLRGSSTVTPFATATNTTGGRIAVPQAALAVAITPDGSTAYVSTRGFVVPITLATGVAEPSIPVAGFFGSIGPLFWVSHPGIAITPDGRTVYVTSGFGAEGVLTPIATATNTPGATIDAGRNPVAIAITPDGTTAYVANHIRAGTVRPITLSTGRAGTPIPVVSRPGAIAITPDGTKAYVAGVDGVTPVTLATNTPGPVIPIFGATGIAIAPDGRTAYATDGTSVTPITLATDVPGTPIFIHTGGPGQIALTPDGTTAYVTNFIRGTVTPITLATGVRGSSFSVGRHPFGIAVGPTLRRTVSASMTCSPAAVVFDQSTTCTAAVTDTDSGVPATPTGTISFKGVPRNDGTLSGSQCSLSGAGATASCQATYTPTAGGAGPQSVLAFYSGDEEHSVGRDLATVDVSYRPISLSVDCGSTPLTVGQPRGCTATVADVAPGSASRPTGTVTLTGEPGDRFIHNSCWLSGSGTAPSCFVVYTPTMVGSGSHTISATYTPNRGVTLASRPDRVHMDSAATIVLTVLHSTSTTLRCADPDLTVGQSTACVATVSDTSPDQTSTPTGIVQFGAPVTDTVNGPCVLEGSGATATCQVTYTAGAGAGAHVITGRYSGDASHHPSHASATIAVARP